MENIQNFILSNTDAISIVEEAPKKKAERKLAEYEVISVSGPDFVVRKKGARGSSLLVCILSKNQFYIKTENTGVTEVLNSKNFMKFLADVSKLSLEDSNGNCPFWVENLEKTKVFTEIFLTAAHNERLKDFFCKDMLCFNDLFPHAKESRQRGYNEVFHSNLFDVDFKIVRFVFEEAAKYTSRDTVKKALAIYLYLIPYDYGYSSVSKKDIEKVVNLFAALLRVKRNWHNDGETLYDWLDRNWGKEGIRQLIKAYFETPVTKIDVSFPYRETIQSTNFALSDFIDYFFCECTKQGYADNHEEFICSWNDCLALQKTIYGKIVNKYPNALASEERALAYKEAKLRELREDEDFNKAVVQMKGFEGEAGDYIIKSPDCQQDLIDEGQMQSNCVGSYIDKIINGKCMVFFMRKKKTPDQSLVTIEVRNNELAQVKARFNKQPSDVEMEAVNTWFDKMFHHEKAALMAA